MPLAERVDVVLGVAEQQQEGEEERDVGRVLGVARERLVEEGGRAGGEVAGARVERVERLADALGEGEPVVAAGERAGGERGGVGLGGGGPEAGDGVGQRGRRVGEADGRGAEGERVEVAGGLAQRRRRQPVELGPEPEPGRRAAPPAAERGGEVGGGAHERGGLGLLVGLRGRRLERGAGGLERGPPAVEVGLGHGGHQDRRVVLEERGPVAAVGVVGRAEAEEAGVAAGPAEEVLEGPLVDGGGALAERGEQAARLGRPGGVERGGERRHRASVPSER